MWDVGFASWDFAGVTELVVFHNQVLGRNSPTFLFRSPHAVVMEDLQRIHHVEPLDEEAKNSFRASIASPHVNSFNRFLDTGIQSVVDHLEPVRTTVVLLVLLALFGLDG